MHHHPLLHVLNHAPPQHARLLLLSPSHPLTRTPEALRRLQTTAERQRRHLATHRESPASSLLSNAPYNGSGSPSSSRTSRGGFAATDTLGPFPLGIRNPNDASKGKQKAWSELSTSGKVARGTARTTNFGVILIGGAFTCVLAYALATELFAKNSPTRLYDDACQRLSASPEVARYLNTPLKFHITAPSPNAPRHRNRHVSSQLAVDSSGREHLLLHFYVEATPLHSATSDSEGLPALSELTVDSVYEWSKETWSDVVDQSKRAFAYLAGIALHDSLEAEQPRPQVPSPVRQTSIGQASKDASGGWGLGKLFSGLRGWSPSAKESSEVQPQAEWTEGEVHADLVKDDDGNFKYRYLLLDIPHSRMRKPLRIYVEKGAGFREGEGVFMWG